MKIGKLIINAVLLVGVVVLSYLLYKSIEEPIAVQTARDKREPLVQERLLDIKKAQMVYLEKYGKFAENFDILVKAVKTDSVAEIKIVGNPDLLEVDSTAVVEYDTMYISFMERAFNTIAYPADSLPFVPYTGGKKFHIQTGTITEANAKIPVFEVSITEKEMLHDKDQKYVSGDKVWKVGSMTEARYDGNWE